MRNLKLLMLVALLAAPATLSAQNAVKIGVINLDRAITESAEGAEAVRQFQEYNNQLNQGLQETQTQLGDAQNRLQTQQRALSQQALTNLQNEITRLQTRLQREVEDADLEANAKQQELFAPIAQKAQQALFEYAEEQRFTLILPVDAVIYASNATDVTNEVIRRMDAMAEAGAAPDAGAAPESEAAPDLPPPTTPEQ